MRFSGIASISRLAAATAAAFASTAIAGGAVQAAPASQDTVNVVVFGTGALVAPGIATSTLVRNDNGVAMTVHTVGLPADTADTVWWVIFNNPAACSHGMGGTRCGLGDLKVAAVRASVQFAAGHVIASDGVGDYGGYLREGDASDCASAALPCNGLISARGADIHLVVRTHGAPIPGSIDDQIHSFNGGCPPNSCANLQAAPHEAN
ncbi:MAG TPA: hypothetical protein VGV88_02800 [Candidatus Dormibacteraeota bacterium]|nr:hypothetical protein [Candidatus Dormibacteraeota bacterium]